MLRRWAERQNGEQRNAFLEQVRRWQANAGLELWFADECGVEGDPRPRRRWSALGGRSREPHLGDHIRANVIGAVCPASGECCTMIFDGVDTDVFQHHLYFWQYRFPLRTRYVDCSSLTTPVWHKAQRLSSASSSSSFTTCQATAPISIQSNGSGCASKSTSLATSLRRARSCFPVSLSRCDFSKTHQPQTVASQCAFRK